MKNPFRNSLLAIMLLATFGAITLAAWMTDDLVWSRLGIGAAAFAALAMMFAAFERAVHDGRYVAASARAERTIDARHALFYRTMRERAMLDERGNIVSLAAQVRIVRTDAERAKFDNIVSGWARTAIERDDAEALAILGGHEPPSTRGLS